jgi:hypothetical protein
MKQLALSSIIGIAPNALIQVIGLIEQYLQLNS